MLFFASSVQALQGHVSVAPAREGVEGNALKAWCSPGGRLWPAQIKLALKRLIETPVKTLREFSFTN